MTTKGFTLIETMVAITILTVAIAGAFFTANSSLVAAEIARDQLTASYLAQEGIEYVRMMRDDEYLKAYQVGGTNVSTTAWNNFLNGSDAASITQCRGTISSPITCTLDPSRSMGSGSGSSLQPCSGSACIPLYLASTGIYNEQSSGTKTSFTRTIQAVDISASDERIVSKVSWSFHGISHSVTITDHLTPWQ
ncbi:MAG: prepilin-type N-terminal cleavage/methylation domain-containing protein [Minisyncoccia bacterium]|jgi:prepilin-type N-terminal cleavage/methylation domain-containing protein